MKKPTFILEMLKQVQHDVVEFYEMRPLAAFHKTFYSHSDARLTVRAGMSESPIKNTNFFTHC